MESGKYLLMAVEKTGIDAIEFSKKAEANGAGEILLTSMDKDGTKSGYDLDLLKIITKSLIFLLLPLEELEHLIIYMKP